MRAFHVVKVGETLQSIARYYYGQSGLWHRIYNKNRGIIANPEVLVPGITITIP